MTDGLDPNSVLVAGTIALTGGSLGAIQVFTGVGIAAPLWLAALPVAGFAIVAAVILILGALTPNTPAGGWEVYHD